MKLVRFTVPAEGPTPRSGWLLGDRVAQVDGWGSDTRSLIAEADRARVKRREARE